MATDFQNAIAALKAEHDAKGIVGERGKLAPIRDAAVTALAELNDTITRLGRAVVTDAIAKHNAACAVGVVYQDLRDMLAEWQQLCNGAPNTFRDVLSAIDGLTEQAVAQGWHRAIPGRLERARDARGALEALAKRIAYAVIELEGLVQRTAAVKA